MQVAKYIYTKYHTEYKAWFDYSKSGDKNITVLYTKGEPQNQHKSNFPWEAGSVPPPFMLQLQKEVEEKRQQGLENHQSGRGNRSDA
jgi:hypothetical protein